MKKDDILVLSCNDINADNVFMDMLNKSEGIQNKCLFKSVIKPLRAIRRVHILSGLPGIGVWFLEWVNEIKPEKKIICIANRYSPFILNWISKKEHTTRLINYYWDCIGISGYPVKNTDCYENWTFCKLDATRYGMKYNPQFYVEALRFENRNVIYDASFVGADREGQWKNRIQLANECYYMLRRNGIKAFFYLVTDSDEAEPAIRQNERMSERKYYQVVAASRAIIELVETDSEWVTLRPLMALANRKKVITNNKTIIEERYYSKDNFFILGMDDERQLKDFLFADFKEIDKEIMNFYEAKSWSKRFFAEE